MMLKGGSKSPKIIVATFHFGEKWREIKKWAITGVISKNEFIILRDFLTANVMDKFLPRAKIILAMTSGKCFNAVRF
jgi:hypothetical protein